MSKSKYFDAICLIVIIFAVGITVAFMNGEQLGIETARAANGYESRLFDTSRVHEIDIVMNDFDELCRRADKNMWYECTAVIDGEKFSNISIRVKGRAAEIESSGSIKYSFKIEFDHTNSIENYHGLDKLELNNCAGDCTYMKDFTVYEMMAASGVPAPLASYAYVTMNGKDVGLYLVVESIEDAFLLRNFGMNSGNLYKPECDENTYAKTELSVGREPATEEGTSSIIGRTEENSGRDVTFADPEAHIDPDVLDDGSDGPGIHIDTDLQDDQNETTDAAIQSGGDADEQADTSGPAGDEGSVPAEEAGVQDAVVTVRPDDIKLIYIDDDPESYPNIFAGSKQDESEHDRKRLIEALRVLNTETDVRRAVDADEVAAYFAVHNFVVSFNSYTGESAANYYLYEKDGMLSMLPWDYSSAFGTYRSQDAGSMVNYPIDTPLMRGLSGERPMFDWIMKDQRSVTSYHAVLKETASVCIGAKDGSDKTASAFDGTENASKEGSVISRIRQIEEMISPYVVQDPNKFSSETAFHKGVSTLISFLELRSRSVLEQLDGEIPSTYDGQNEALESLIDASEIELIDMK